MNQQRIQVPKAEAFFPTGLKRKCFIVTLVELIRKTAEECTHSDVHFAVAVVHSRVNKVWSAAAGN